MSNHEEKKEMKGIVVKGYMRPDGSYYTTVPKAIVEALGLKGGELFLLKVKSDEREIKVKIIDIPKDEHETE